MRGSGGNLPKFTTGWKNALLAFRAETGLISSAETMVEVRGLIAR